MTVRTHLERFVGGATEETIIARVGEGIVATIGSAGSYKDVLEHPDSISKTVLGKALDSNTAFEILSIDIADVNVGENVGARLQAEQAEANKLIAQAQAEVRRAAAVALEQEMLARVQEMRARVVEAEAQIPLAMAEAFRSGNLGVMDYYRMKNIQADTGMRDSIAGAGGPGAAGGAAGSQTNRRAIDREKFLNVCRSSHADAEPRFADRADAGEDRQFLDPARPGHRFGDLGMAQKERPDGTNPLRTRRTGIAALDVCTASTCDGATRRIPSPGDERVGEGIASIAWR